MVALAGLLELVQVCLEGLLRLPRGAVDALEHRLVLAAAPVGARGAQQLEGRDALGGRDVGTSAQVDPGLLTFRAHVAVDGVDRLLVRADGRVLISAALADALDDLALVGLVGEQGERVLLGQLLADEGLALLHQLLHAGLDALEVLGGEGALDVEVVVEAVLDRWADRPLGVRVQVGDGLRHQVGHRVAQDGAPLLGVGVDGLDGHDTIGSHPLPHGAVEVPLVPVHGGGDDLAPDGLEGLQGLQGSGAGVELDAVVGVVDGDLVRHEVHAFESWPRVGQGRSCARASLGRPAGTSVPQVSSGSEE